ncbi:60S ribosomal protein L36-A [Dictyocoela muelleri]|nr:60S ribosomal protein L36-A [Dictyocoela muelleri]
MLIKKDNRKLHHKTEPLKITRLHRHKKTKFFFRNKNESSKENKNKELMVKNNESFKLASQIVREVCGYAPYEIKAMDLIKKDMEKKCKKFLRKRLGSLKAAKKRIDLLTAELRGN